MEILIFDREKSKHSGYFYREQSGKIVPMGFRDLIGKNVRFSEYDDKTERTLTTNGFGRSLALPDPTDTKPEI